MKPSNYIYIILFFILMLTAHPFYMKQSIYEWVYKSTIENDVAQIDICAHNLPKLSDKTNDIEDISIDIPEKANANGQFCTEIKLPITAEWQNYDISFKVKGNNKIKIQLKSPEYWGKEGRQPILTDYKDLYINTKQIDMPEKSVWYNNSYSLEINNNNNEQTTISVKTRRHHLKFSDIKLIYDTYFDWGIFSNWLLIGSITIAAYTLLLINRKKYKYLFCFIVFIFLILPVIYISKDDYSKQENRSYNKFPILFTNNSINEDFGIEFEKWFSDRFGGRRTLIDTRFFILYKINNKIENRSAFIGDEEWKFPTKGTKSVASVENQRKENMELANNLKKISDSMNGKNIQFYVVLEPSRSVLYKKYWEKYYPYIPYHDYAGELKTALKHYNNIHFIDLKDTFEKNKDTIRLYEKNDSHMTLTAVNMMMDEIASGLGSDVEKKYKEIITYKDKDCKLYETINYYDHLLRIEPHIKKETCKQIITKNKHTKTRTIIPGMNEATNSKPYVNKDLYILFPCYEEFIFPIFSEIYSHTISVNYNTFDEHDEDELKKQAISRLKTIKSGTVVLIFLSYPTEYNISRSTEYLEAY